MTIYVTIDEQIAILQAAKDGKTIQFRDKSNPVDIWTEFSRYDRFNFEDWEYRVKPETRVVYVNLYGCNDGAVYKTKAKADGGAGANRIACVRVEYQEGQFDD